MTSKTTTQSLWLAYFGLVVTPLFWAGNARAGPRHGHAAAAAVHVVLALGHRPGHPVAGGTAGPAPAPRGAAPTPRHHAGAVHLQRRRLQFVAVLRGHHHQRHQHRPDQRHHSDFRGTAGMAAAGGPDTTAAGSRDRPRGAGHSGGGGAGPVVGAERSADAGRRPC